MDMGLHYCFLGIELKSFRLVCRHLQPPSSTLCFKSVSQPSAHYISSSTVSSLSTQLSLPISVKLRLNDPGDLIGLGQSLELSFYNHQCFLHLLKHSTRHHSLSILKNLWSFLDHLTSQVHLIQAKAKGSSVSKLCPTTQTSCWDPCHQ